MRSISFVSVIPLLGGMVAHAASTPPVDFEAKIAPLLQEHCVDCHAADDADGDFALDTFAALIKGGKAGKALVPGDAQNSLLVKFLEGRSGKEGKNQFMPPGKRDHLTPEQIGVIRSWIDQGAPAPAVAKAPVDLLANLPKIAPKTAPQAAVISLAYSPKAKLIAAGSYGQVRVINPNGLTTIRSLTGIAGKVNTVAFSADGTQVFAAAGDAGVNGIAYQWNVSDGALVRKFEGHNDALYALALAPDGRTLATGSYDQKIKVWDLSTGAEVRVLTGHNGGVFGLAFRPDGKILASASADRTVKLWEVATGRRLDTFSQPLKEQGAVAFSPDGELLAAGGTDNRLRVWRVSAGGVEGSNQLLATRFAHEGALLNVAFSPDGKQIVTTAADRSAKIWSGADYAEAVPLEKQSDWAPAVAALGEDKVLLGRLDGTFGVYGLTTGKSVGDVPVAKASKKPAATDTKPMLTRVEPRGVQSGATTRLKVIGKNLAGLKFATFSHPGLKAAVVSVNPEGTAGELDVVADSTVPRSQVEMAVATPTGETARLKVNVDYLPQVVGGAEAASADLKLPVNVWGTLRQTGQVDGWKFAARQGETVVFDLAAKRLESKAVSPRLEIVDARGKLLAANNGLDSGSDPFIAFQAPEDGEYKVLVREITLSGSEDHVYRLTAGVLPYVTGWWPIAASPNAAVTVHLVGHNLKATEEPLQMPAEGEAVLPLDTDHYRSQVSMKLAVSRQPQVGEVEPNDSPTQAQTLAIPASVTGRLYSEASSKVDADLFRFEAVQGQQVVLETRAGMMGSPADTKLEVLDAKGEVVPMMRMQATKDSWITLRSEDANDPAIRLGHFAEMDLNDYMFFNGEVLKIYRLARGPDADMVYFANGGKRRAYFNTSPAGHGLDDACYTVEPRPLDKVITPNGLPVFTLYYANDDDGFRELGRDSRLIFTAPAAGVYFVRVSDTRGWSGERQAYQLILRAPAPDFTPRLRMPAQLSIPVGAGAQFAVTVDRVDDFEGAVRVEVSDVPEGFYVSSPLVVEAGHLDVAGSIYALPGTAAGSPDFSKVKVTATALVEGKEVAKPVAGFAKVTVAPPLKRSVFMEPDVAGKAAGDGKTAPAKPYEITLASGSQVPAWLRMDRRGDDALIGLDVEGLPHGVIVDNIGLNGVQIRAGENEREIFLSCAPWVAEQDRLCHVVVGSARNDAVKADGAQTGFPVLLKIRKAVKAVAGQ